MTSRPPSGSGVSPFGLAKPRGGSWAQLSAEDARDLLRAAELDDAAVLDVGDGRLAVPQPVGVVRRVQVAGARAGDAVVAVPPDRRFVLSDTSVSVSLNSSFVITPR